MKIKDLMEKLSNYDSNTEVCFSYGPNRDGPGYYFPIENVKCFDYYQWDNDDMLLADPIDRYDIKNNKETSKQKGIVVIFI